MDVLIDRVAGLDVHRDTVVAAVRVPGRGGGRRGDVRTFSTTGAGLTRLAAWLSSERVSLVGMESTGIYWKPVYYMLEDSFECWLLNAQHMHNVPGRKTDVADSLWIAQLLEHGLVRPSFVPPKPIRALRDLTRHRRTTVEDRTRAVQRLEKVMQDCGIKLTSVASELLGKSGRAMIEAMLAGEDDPDVLADLARRRLRAKIPQLREALAGRPLADHQKLLVRQLLAQIDLCDSAVAELDHRIEVMLAPFSELVERVTTIPGVGRRTAECLIAESGSRSALPRSGPLRTVRAPRRRTRLKQAARALRVEARASCVCGLGARGGRRHASSGFGSFPACHSRGDGRGTRRRLPVGPRSATSVPTPKETGVAGRRQADDRDRAGSGRPAG